LYFTIFFVDRLYYILLSRRPAVLGYFRGRHSGIHADLLLSVLDAALPSCPHHRPSSIRRHALLPALIIAHHLSGVTPSCPPSSSPILIFNHRASCLPSHLFNHRAPACPPTAYSHLQPSRLLPSPLILCICPRAFVPALTTSHRSDRTYCLYRFSSTARYPYCSLGISQVFSSLLTHHCG
jgi:hypothetical protein